MTDKILDVLYHEHHGKVSDKWQIYISEYDRLFSQYLGNPVNLLEIGIQNGGSLEIWAKYFPRAENIIGCDVNPDCASLVYDDARIAVLVGDANSDPVEKLIVKRCSKFDVIIDDGSHLTSDIIKSFVRYFPYLDDGGIFVAEDLHCSYWKEFEGGLFDPLSSVSFFKRLADIISHEHWGVDRSRSEVLKGFFDKYHVQLTENLLQHIHSIEFINSMCVIRKEKPEANILGSRVIGGKIEDIVPGHSELQDTHNLTPSQKGNYWSECKTPPDEGFVSLTELIKERDGQLAERDGQIVSLNQAVAERDSQIVSLNQTVTECGGVISQILSSNSWRLTYPLRAIKSYFFKEKA